MGRITYLSQPSSYNQIKSIGAFPGHLDCQLDGIWIWLIMLIHPLVQVFPRLSFLIGQMGYCQFISNVVVVLWTATMSLHATTRVNLVELANVNLLVCSEACSFLMDGVNVNPLLVVADVDCQLVGWMGYGL
jgi:hypothetical protein